jgi:hypothetical protein
MELYLYSVLLTALYYACLATVQEISSIHTLLDTLIIPEAVDFLPLS